MSCAAKGCEVKVASGLLMCKTHWYQVSAMTRTLVNDTWRRYQRDPEMHQPYYRAVATAKAEVEAAQQRKRA